VAHICIKPIGVFILKSKCSFMVDFDIVFIKLLHGLERLGPSTWMMWLCYTIQDIFVVCIICVLTMMDVCGNIRRHDC
jgi:hypothetical protein